MNNEETNRGTELRINTIVNASGRALLYCYGVHTHTSILSARRLAVAAVAAAADQTDRGKIEAPESSAKQTTTGAAISLEMLVRAAGKRPNIVIRINGIRAVTGTSICHMPAPGNTFDRRLRAAAAAPRSVRATT